MSATNIPFAASIEHDVITGAKKVLLINALAVDSTGNIYLLNSSNSTVKKYNASGVLQETITLSEGE